MSEAVFDAIVTDFTPYTSGSRRVREYTLNNRLVVVHSPERYYVPELSTTDTSRVRMYILQCRYGIPCASPSIKFPSAGDAKPWKPVSIVPANFEIPRLDEQTSDMLLNWGCASGDYLLNNGNPRDWGTKYTVDLLTIIEPYRIVSGEEAYTVSSMTVEADSISGMIHELVNVNQEERVRISDPPAEFNVTEAPSICLWGLSSELSMIEFYSSSVAVAAYYPTAIQLAAHVAVWLDVPLIDLSYHGRIDVPGHHLHWSDEELISTLGVDTVIYVGLQDDIASDIANSLREAGVSEVHGLVSNTWDGVVVEVAIAVYGTWGAEGIVSSYQDMSGDVSAVTSAYGSHLYAPATKETPDPIEMANKIKNAIGTSLPVIVPARSINEAWLLGIILMRKYRLGEDVTVPPVYYHD